MKALPALVLSLTLYGCVSAGTAAVRKAEALFESGDVVAAARWYREALRRSPSDGRIRFILRHLGVPVSDDELAAMLRAWAPPDVELRPDVVYASSTRPLRMHVLLPRNPATSRPAILFIHGGGWTEGTRERGLPSLIHFVKPMDAFLEKHFGTP